MLSGCFHRMIKQIWKTGDDRQARHSGAPGFYARVLDVHECFLGLVYGGVDGECR